MYSRLNTCLKHSDFLKVNVLDNTPHSQVQLCFQDKCSGCAKYSPRGRTSHPQQKSNYELFNRNNFNIRYWSWNYRGCWHQTWAVSQASSPESNPYLSSSYCHAQLNSRLPFVRHRMGKAQEAMQLNSRQAASACAQGPIHLFQSSTTDWVALCFSPWQRSRKTNRKRKPDLRGS